MNVVDDLLCFMNNEDDLYDRDLRMFFGKEYEINYDNNRVPILWHNVSEDKYEYCGVYDGIYEDLIECGGLRIDGKVYELTSFDYD